ncbi:MAG: RidA family protein [Flavisolibacter sp.]
MSSTKTILSFILTLLAYSATAQSDTLSKKKFHWGVANSDTSAGYAQALLVDNVLYISGTIGHGTTMAEQLKSLYTGIERTLKHYGLDFKHVVKENLYTIDIEAAKANNAIRKSFYKGDFPAATWVQISRLYMSTALVEVEVIAHLPGKKE